MSLFCPRKRRATYPGSDRQTSIDVNQVQEGPIPGHSKPAFVSGPDKQPPDPDSASNPQSGAASARTVPADPLTELDEYGTELHKDARVWKVYVKETDKHDTELVSGWNESTDVVLIFGTLFSVISTAFILESSKLLQPDPAEVSSQTLLVMSQTLLLIANGTPPSAPTTQSMDNPADFTPSRVAVCVNILWYLSLSLSLAASFIALLAKDWCRSFMAGRTGHPSSQARRRQQKWTMIERWKMEELLTVLPSLIHVALFLFFIGLCIQLWETHTAVAIPVICVSGIAFGFYVGSSVAATIEFFPYPTIISRICRSQVVQSACQLVLQCLSFFWGLLYLCLGLLVWPVCYPFVRMLEAFIDCHNFDDPPSCLPWLTHKVWRWLRCHPLNASSTIGWMSKWFPKPKWGQPKANSARDVLQGEDRGVAQEEMTGFALSWLIKNGQAPQPVDIALQSIAGATERIPQKPLLECQAAPEILRRPASSNLQRGASANSTAISSLYSRAPSFLNTASDQHPGSTQSGPGRELEQLIGDLQAETEKAVAGLIVDGDFKPTRWNLEALRIGGSTASTGLKILHMDPQNASLAADQVLDSTVKLLESHLDNHQTLHPAALLSLVNAAALFSLLASESPRASALPLLCIRLVHSGVESLNWHTQLVNCLATECMLLSNKCLVRDQLSKPDGLSWSETVVRGFIDGYSREKNSNALPMISCLGLYELLSHRKDYHLENTQPEILSDLVASANNHIIAHPGHWPLSGGEDDESFRAYALLYMQALHVVYNLTPAREPGEHDHLFVLEVMCRVQTPSSPLWAQSQQLISKFRFPTQSDSLLRLVGACNIIPLLGKMTAADDPALEFFAAGQLWLLFTLYLDPSCIADKQGYLGRELGSYKRKNPEIAEVQHSHLAEDMEKYWDASNQAIVKTLGVWAYRLMECVLEARNQQLPEQLHNALRNVPQEVRGLVSFTKWRPVVAEEPEAADAQRIDSESFNESGTTDSNNSNTGPRGGHTAGSGGRTSGVAAETDSDAQEQIVERVEMGEGHGTAGERDETVMKGPADSIEGSGAGCKVAKSGAVPSETVEDRQGVAGAGGGNVISRKETGAGGSCAKDGNNGTGGGGDETESAEDGTTSKDHLAIDVLAESEGKSAGPLE